MNKINTMTQYTKLREVLASELSNKYKKLDLVSICKYLQIQEMNYRKT
jgi:hypothetical protein